MVLLKSKIIKNVRILKCVVYLKTYASKREKQLRKITRKEIIKEDI